MAGSGCASLLAVAYEQGLFQEAGLTAKASDDLSAKSTEFLELMVKLAGSAGGAAPLPECPKPTHILDLRSLAGNERLQAILTHHDTLKVQAKTWREAAELAERRTPIWQRLQRFLKHSRGVEGFDETESAANGIQANRLLLDATDHVTPLLKKAAAALRTSVKTAHEQFQQCHATEKARLEAADAWKCLSDAQRQSISQQFGSGDVPAVSLGTDDELLTTLDRTPLGSWRDKTDALTGRISQAITAAAKLLEPKIQTVRLTSGTLKTDAEVRGWLSQQERQLLAKLKDGPIVIQ